MTDLTSICERIIEHLPGLVIPTLKRVASIVGAPHAGRKAQIVENIAEGLRFYKTQANFVDKCYEIYSVCQWSVPLSLTALHQQRSTTAVPTTTIPTTTPTIPTPTTTLPSTSATTYSNVRHRFPPPPPPGYARTASSMTRHRYEEENDSDEHYSHFYGNRTRTLFGMAGYPYGEYDGEESPPRTKQTARKAIPRVNTLNSWSELRENVRDHPSSLFSSSSSSTNNSSSSSSYANSTSTSALPNTSSSLVLRSDSSSLRLPMGGTSTFSSSAEIHPVSSSHFTRTAETNHSNVPNNSHSTVSQHRCLRGTPGCVLSNHYRSFKKAKGDCFVPVTNPNGTVTMQRSSHTTGSSASSTSSSHPSSQATSSTSSARPSVVSVSSNSLSSPPSLPSPSLLGKKYTSLVGDMEYMPMVSSTEAQRCSCGIVPIHKDVVVRCSSLNCKVRFHLPCAGYNPEHTAVLTHRWRCPLCRAIAMNPLCELVNVIASPLSLRPSHSETRSLSLSFNLTKSPSEYRQANESVRLICMTASPESDVVCTWPSSASLSINGGGIAVPQIPPGSRSAPLLDITTLLKIGGNSVALKTSPSPSSSTGIFYLFAIIVRTVNREAIIDRILKHQVLDISFARLSHLVSFELAKRPGGKWLGISKSSFSNLRELWKQVSNILLSKGIGTKNVTYSATGGLSTLASSAEPSSLMVQDLQNLLRTLQATLPHGSASSSSSSSSSACSESSSSSSSSTESTTTTLMTDEPEIDIEYIALSLRDPASLAPISIPVRGDVCTHAQCIDLVTFLELNNGPSPRWRCPLCKVTLMPYHLYVDTYVVAIMRAIHAGYSNGGIPRTLSSSSSHADTMLQAVTDFVALDDGMKVLQRSIGSGSSSAFSSSTTSLSSSAITGVGPVNIAHKGLSVASEIAAIGIELLENCAWRLPKGRNVADVIREDREVIPTDDDDDDDGNDFTIPVNSTLIRQLTQQAQESVIASTRRLHNNNSTNSNGTPTPATPATTPMNQNGTSTTTSTATTTTNNNRSNNDRNRNSTPIVIDLLDDSPSVRTESSITRNISPVVTTVTVPAQLTTRTGTTTSSSTMAGHKRLRHHSMYDPGDPTENNDDSVSERLFSLIMNGLDAEIHQHHPSSSSSSGQRMPVARYTENDNDIVDLT